MRQTAKPKTPRKKSDSAVRAHAARDSFREEDGSDDDAAISINAIKNKYKGAAATAAAAAAAKGNVLLLFYPFSQIAIGLVRPSTCVPEFLESQSIRAVSCTFN